MKVSSTFPLITCSGTGHWSRTLLGKERPDVMKITEHEVASVNPIPGSTTQALKRLVVCLLSLIGIAGAICASASAATSVALTLTSSGNTVTTVALGSVVTLTATVKAGSTPVTVGQVKFCNATAAYCEDSALLGTAQLTSAGTAKLNLRLGVGSRSVKALFVGTTTYTRSEEHTSE